MGSASGPGVSISLSGWETIGSKDKPWPMLTHEIGHIFGFPDFLDDYNGFPNRTTCDLASGYDAMMCWKCILYHS
ncbi:hypothetical protein BHE90_012477 [Fusarium euwallaceae]|uniref:Uncharacterized protein n=1 Tax=Fusarium euwallaceae TaxID=1147111 RepID=A0A430LBG5_9HYPO|nr:hypothetical protein BHE90_012477 [Fusarium euwallaceae]